MKLSIIGFVTVLGIVSSGCHGMHMHMGSGTPGSGKVVTEDRKVSGFTRIRHEGAGEVSVTAGKDFSTKLTIDDNLAKFVKTEVDGDTLVIKNSKDINPTEFKVAITLPNLAAYKIDGAGDVKISGVDSDSLEAEIDGAGNIVIAGVAKSATLSIDGAGAIEANDLKTETAKASIDGAGSIKVSPTELLDAKVDGAGSVQYKSKPKSIKQKVDGIGSIDKE